MKTWFGVRSLYRFGRKPDGTNIFEERIVCFEAEDFDEANDKAHRESKIYASDNGFEWYPVTVAYEQEGDALIDGYEVWSELYESTESLESFWHNRYARFEYLAVVAVLLQPHVAIDLLRPLTEHGQCLAFQQRNRFTPIHQRIQFLLLARC